MTDTYDPGADFRYGLTIWVLIAALSLPLSLIVPRVALLVFGLGSLATYEHLFRVLAHSDSAKWRLITLATLALVALAFVAAAWWHTLLASR